ncbi:hypothetical protein M501DRAFT_989061 [Patellaria atrata CBS 101060]|uniref:C2H2-type domain-containing protein n=1 Tax=Patellaria atrata CBS 101060 TaxID=1346257 RepID=A0A9P4VPB1_9PEZI|nr:hypothetical protein M501DRAFT_989061 [Patellaria atrata CBS 101060]
MRLASLKLSLLLVVICLLIGCTSGEPMSEDAGWTGGSTEYPYPSPNDQLLCYICSLASAWCKCQAQVETTQRPDPEQRIRENELYLRHPYSWERHTSPIDPRLIQRIDSPQASNNDTVSPPDLEWNQRTISPSLLIFREESPADIQEAIPSWTEDTYNAGDRTGLSDKTKRIAPVPGGFRCDYPGCSIVCNRKCELNRHMKKHLPKSRRNHKCETCDERFLYPKDKRRHEESVHKRSDTSPRFECNVRPCHARCFSREDNLRRHIRKQHPNTA